MPPTGSLEKSEALIRMKHAELAAPNILGGYWVAAADPTLVRSPPGADRRNADENDPQDRRPDRRCDASGQYVQAIRLVRPFAGVGLRMA